MVWWWWIIPALLAALGVITLIGGVVWLFLGHVFGAVGRVFGGLIFLGVAGAALLIGQDVQTYSRLTYERPVATLELHKKGPRLFDAVLTQPASPALPGGSVQHYDIQGDEWRVEARVLKWRPWANVLGLDSQYRLDRLSGRYQDTQSELYAPRSVYDLRPVADSRVDLWTLARRYSHTLPVVDTLYGSGASMPMADGGRYEVWITQNGLIARPANPAANEAMASGWR